MHFPLRLLVNIIDEFILIYFIFFLFQAEHHRVALQHLHQVRFRIDHAAKRVGFFLTQDTKYAMATLLNCMLREQRLSFMRPLITSMDPEKIRGTIANQLTMYSVQYKEASSIFCQGRQAISGKIGANADDLCIALQLVVFCSSKASLYQ